MSTSMLHHTFGIVGVQYISTDFLTARPFSADRYTPTISSARTANLAMSSDLARLHALSKCYLLETEKSR